MNAVSKASHHMSFMRSARQVYAPLLLSTGYAMSPIKCRIIDELRPNLTPNVAMCCHCLADLEGSPRGSTWRGLKKITL